MLRNHSYILAFVLGCCVLARSAYADAVVETTTDMTAQGNWTVEVAEGCSNIVTVAQTGAGKITKTGLGFLVFTTENTYTGGTDVQAGFVRIEHNHALGTGLVTIQGGNTQFCELQLMGAGKGDTTVLTLTNDIHVVGATSGTYPAIMAFGQNAELTGNITAEKNFVFLDDFQSTAAISSSWFDRYQKVVSLVFRGTVTAAEGIGNSGVCRFRFYGKVTAPIFDATIHRPVRAGDGVDGWDSQNNAHSSYEFFAVNAIGKYVTRRNAFYAGVANACPGMIFHYVTKNTYSSSTFFLRDYNSSTHTDQTLAGLTSDPYADVKNLEYGLVSSEKAHTLTITGVQPEAGESSRELVACIRLQSNLSVKLDASTGFTQTISNRIHTMNGTITATKGKFRVAGNASFSNVTAVVVGAGGAFECDSSQKGVLSGVTSLTLAGPFTLPAGREWPFTDKLQKLNFSDGAKFAFPADMTALTVKELTINGVQHQCGTVAQSELPSGVTLPEGFTLTVTGLIAASSTVEFNDGASGDHLMTTLENWNGLSALPDLATGMTAVKMTAGTAMTPGEGRTFLHSLESACAYEDANSVPFVLGAAGKKLEVAGAIQSINQRQLIVTGEIAPPDGVGDQGAAVSGGAYTFTYHGKKMTDVVWPAEYICGDSNSKKSAMLVLDGATIAKPLYLKTNGSTGSAVFCTKENTVNRISGTTYFQNSNGWMQMHIAPGSSVEFTGGISAGSRVMKYGSGTLTISGKPWNGGSGLTIGAGKVILNVENNWFGQVDPGRGLDLNGSSAQSVEFLRSYCFTDDHQLSVRSSKACTLEFHSTTQRVAQLGATSSNAASALHGDAGSMIEITGGCREKMTEGFAGLSCSVQITGALGVHMMGTGTGYSKDGTVYAEDGTNSRYVLSGKAFESSGPLMVSGGQLSLGMSASWKNGTDFIACGTGQLRLAGTDQLSRENAVIYLSDEATLHLGGVQHVHAVKVKVDGEWQDVPVGWYDTNTKTGLLANRIVSGDGRLHVGEKGSVVIIR